VTLGNQEAAAATSAAQPQASYVGNLAANAQQYNNATASLGASMLSSSAANAAAAQAASDARRQSDTQQSLNDLSNTRLRLLGSRAADIAREFDSLRSNESTKANALAQLNLASDQLGEKSYEARLDAQLRRQQMTATAKQKAADRRTRRAIADQTASVQLSAQQIRARNDDRQYQLNVRKFGAAQARDMYLRTHGLGPYAKRRGASGLTQIANNRITSQIQNAHTVVNFLRGARLTDAQIRSALGTGGRFTGSAGRRVAWGAMPDAVIDAAFNLANPRLPALTNVTVQRLHRLGYTIGGNFDITGKLPRGVAGPPR